MHPAARLHFFFSTINRTQTKPGQRKNADVTGGPLTHALLLLGARSAPLSQAQEHQNALNLSPPAAARFSPTSAGRDKQTHDKLDLARLDPSLKGTTCSLPRDTKYAQGQEELPLDLTTLD